MRAGTAALHRVTWGEPPPSSCRSAIHNAKCTDVLPRHPHATLSHRVTTTLERHDERHMTKIQRSGNQPTPIATPGAARVLAAGSSQANEVSRLSKAAATMLTGQPNASIPPELLTSIRQLHGSGEALHKAACRVFLRHQLARSLGIAASTEESLDALVGDVVKLMEADRELHASILAAGQSLVQMSRKSSVG